MQNKKILILFLFTFPLSIYAQDSIALVPKYSYGTIQELWQQIDDIFNDPNFSNANWGAVIQSLSTGEYFYKRNENKLFIPASNLKILTTSSALFLLGPDYKFKTEIYIDGKVDGSVLNGNLIVKGYGDPTISGRFNNDKIIKIFEDWADTLLSEGIDEIRGNIIGDDNVFDDVDLGTGWSWDIESYWFAAPTSALSFNDNCISITVVPTENGKQAKIFIQPETKYSIVINNVITVPSDSNTTIDVYRNRGTNIINVFGTIQKNSKPVKTFATINNPTQYFVVILKDVLNKKGIKVSGYPIDIDDLNEPIDYNKCSLLFTHYSKPLSEILKVINKNSQNFFAEQLLKVLGYELKKYGSALNGIEVEKEFLEDTGIDPQGLSIVDGSGLSRLNLVSPNQIITLLNYIFRNDLFHYFYNSLPIAGIDGTLAERMRKTRAQNNVHAKTGLLENVRSLSGYVFTGDDEPIAFSIIANNFVTPYVLAENLQDLVCMRLANFRRK